MSTVKPFQTMTHVITGDAEKDREQFSACNSIRSTELGQHHRIDLAQLQHLDIVTLGLLAWMQERIESTGETVEYVNTSQKMESVLSLYGVTNK